MTKIDKFQKATKEEIEVKFQNAFEDLDEAVDKYNEGLGEAWAKVEEACGEYNDAIEELWEPVEAAQQSYNEVISEANSLRQEIAGEIEEYMGERSEKWQESEKAAQYETWKERFSEDWDEIDLTKPDGLEFDEPEKLDLDIENHAELTGQLPESLEEA